jgi:hypothetical protein
LLAGAVSGMHWTAAVGTVYRERDETLRNGSQLSRSQVVIVCSVLVSIPKPLRSMHRSDRSIGMCLMCDPVCLCCCLWWQSPTIDYPRQSACSCLRLL